MNKLLMGIWVKKLLKMPKLVDGLKEMVKWPKFFFPKLLPETPLSVVKEHIVYTEKYELLLDLTDQTMVWALWHLCGGEGR